MATIVQSKVFTGTGSASYTITLDAPATPGNDIIFIGASNTQPYSGLCTFDGSNMTTDVSADFGLKRIARFRVTSGGTDCVINLGGTSDFRGAILEVSGLAASPLEATVAYTPTGEGSATAHSCEYAAGAVSRFGVVGAFVLNARTFTGANGSSVLPIGTNGAVVVYKDALGSAAGSIDFTVNVATAFSYFAATYLNTGGGGSSQGKAARLLLP